MPVLRTHGACVSEGLHCKASMQAETTVGRVSHSGQCVLSVHMATATQGLKQLKRLDYLELFGPEGRLLKCSVWKCATQRKACPLARQAVSVLCLSL